MGGYFFDIWEYNWAFTFAGLSGVINLIILSFLFLYIRRAEKLIFQLKGHESKSLQKINLMGLSRRELEDFFVSIEEKPFRATQIIKWIHQEEFQMSLR